MCVQAVLASRLVVARKNTPKAGPERSKLVKQGKASIDSFQWQLGKQTVLINL